MTPSLPKADGRNKLGYSPYAACFQGFEGPANALPTCAFLLFCKVSPDVFSGSRDLDDVKKAYLLGAAGYLVKPQMFQDFADSIKVVYNVWQRCEPPALDV